MPASQRRPHLAVIPELLREPQRFGFFQAVRLLDRWLAQGAPGAQGLDRVHFRNSLALSFPPSEIEALRLTRRQAASVDGAAQAHEPGLASAQAASGDSALAGPSASLLLGEALDQVLAAAQAAEQGGSGALPGSSATALPHVDDIERIELTPAFMGLLGVAGTLPFHYTETLAQRELYQKDQAPRAFMDIFSHRAVMLFYEAWRKHRLPIQFEADRRQKFLPLVLSLAGLGHKGLRDRLGGQQGAVADEALAYFAGTLQQRTRSPRQLQQMLQQYLGVPVRVEQFIGRWYHLPKSHLPVLGGGSLGQGASGALGVAAGGAAAILGRTTTLGERVWQRDTRLRLVLGPLSRGRFQRFLPGEAGAQALQSWLTMFSGVSLEYEVNLTLQQDDVQGCALDSQRPASLGRLGWDTFLLSQAANGDRADVRYDIHAAA